MSNINDEKYNYLAERFEHVSYQDFLEIMRIELGDFFRLAENARTVRHASLKARQQSMKLRFLFKLYRTKAIENDERINRIMLDAKRQLKEL